uniref:BRCT domain-containing protein n=1 Tax=Salix viminalis TaxID=40686 RepID=A0A6N2KVK7_SALVM
MQESIKDQEDKNKQVVSEAQTLMSKKKETELLVSKLEEKIDALSEGSRSSENKMQDLLSKISALEIENKDNAETLQSKIQRKEESRKQIMCVQGEHAALVLGIQQERDGKEISLKAAHSEELKCAKLQAENEMREKIMEVRTEHEVQMKALTCQHEDECRKLQEELDLQKDEGIVLKDLGSKWEPSDRSGKWLKLKPEYVRAGSDLDALIMGGYYGSGRRGGENGYPKKSPPSFYQVTNNSKERPNVWIESPDKSIILSITSDIRTISSVVFSAPYSLRFPRIDRVRYDKLWHECLDVQSFIELVHSSNGTTQNGKGFGDVQTSKPTRVKSSWKGEKKRVSVVPSHLIQTDISDIKGETLIFSNVMFYFVNVPPTNLLESLHKMVAENGRTFSMNLNNSVTHCIAAESKGFKYQAAKLHGDIIHGSWIVKLLPLQPKYFAFLSDGSKKKLQEETDEFYDSYYWDLDLSDINQLLSNINTSENAKAIDYFKKKESLTPDGESLLGLAFRRLKLEIFMGGGKVSNNIAHATHLVVLIVPASDVDFGSLVKSFTTAEKHFLLNKRLYVIGSQWLEDSLQRGHKLLEDTYNLKPFWFGGVKQQGSFV